MKKRAVALARRRINRASPTKQQVVHYFVIFSIQHFLVQFWTSISLPMLAVTSFLISRVEEHVLCISKVLAIHMPVWTLIFPYMHTSKKLVWHPYFYRLMNVMLHREFCVINGSVQLFSLLASWICNYYSHSATSRFCFWMLKYLCLAEKLESDTPKCSYIETNKFYVKLLRANDITWKKCIK